jgi:LysM repeat protein/ABC-type branched-subunit amino acid transport system substrate-binding protein
MKSKFFFLIISFFFFAVAAFSQDVKISTVIEKIDGKEYYIHTVQKKESVWKIAKAYNVSSEDIIAMNPGSDKKIKPGQKLKILVKTAEVKKTAETFDHTIEKGESLYTIAKKYSVTIDDIYKANPGLTEKIKPGQIIKIPGNQKNGNLLTKKDSSIVKTDSVYDCSKPKLLDSYNIALMIPFYLGSIYQVNPDDPDIRDKDANDYLSLTYIQYYEGLLMAIDSLKSKGFSAKVYVYDVDADTAATQKILEKPEMTKMHLIIGPFFDNSFNVVARFALKNHIKLVDPLSSGNDMLNNDPYVFKATPSVDMQLKQLAAFIVGRYPKSPVIIVHNDKENEKAYVSVFEKALNNEQQKAGLADSSFKEIIYSQDGFSGITKYFSGTDTNIIVTLSNGEIFVTNYVSNFNNIYDKYKMIVFGLPSWKNFDNIETEYMQNINLHIFSTSFIDYLDPAVQNFTLKFRDLYKTEPEKYAFQGFDVGMVFFSALKNYGVNFDKCIDNIGGKYLQSTYTFIKAGPKDGFENSFLNIYRYEDYRFIDVRDFPKIKEKEKEKRK